jgi:hypothetical protein
MNPIAIRLLNQQLIAPQYSNPAEVVSFMGAMQAQVYLTMIFFPPTMFTPRCGMPRRWPCKL